MTDERALADAALAALTDCSSGPRRWPAVAERVREARKCVGLSQDALATRLGITSSEYQDIELHDDEAFLCFSVTRLAQLAAILRMPIEALLFGPNTPPRRATTSFTAIANRLSALAEAKRLTIDELGDRVGWELGGVIARPASLGEFNVKGLYDACVAVDIDWVTAFPVTEADRPAHA